MNYSKPPLHLYAVYVSHYGSRKIKWLYHSEAAAQQKADKYNEVCEPRWPADVWRVKVEDTVDDTHNVDDMDRYGHHAGMSAQRGVVSQSTHTCYPPRTEELPAEG